MRSCFLWLLLCLVCSRAFSQTGDLKVSSIDPSLLKNANAVVREDRLEVEVTSVDKQVINHTRTVTVLNELGDKAIRAYEYYDDVTQIKDQRAYIFSSKGEEIDKLKRRDFKDVSAVDNNTLYADSRVSYLDYTPRKYPYTIRYESEIVRKSTAFINDWRPIRSYHLSVENSSYSFKNPDHLPVRFKEKNLDSLDIQKTLSEFELDYSLKDFPALKYESLTPELEELTPEVEVALSKFSLVGVEGSAENWSQFGKWQYENLLKGRDKVPQTTVEKLTELTKGITSEREKAKIVYKYVQDHTHYISVQLGIGGWMPMLAEDVDRLGYGDCKALTNYTRALLKTQGIPSNYAVVYAGEEMENIDPEFASMQGTHVILNVPQQEGEDIWLECTSQTIPFDFLGDFTDNRNVLLVKPEGGEIVKTRRYDTSDNLQEIQCDINIERSGKFTAELERKNFGISYGEKYRIEQQKQEIKEIYYKEELSNLKKLQLKRLAFEDDKNEPKFTEKLSLEGEKLAISAGKRLLLSLNFIYPKTFKLPREQHRLYPVRIARGQTHKENFRYRLPEGYEVESIPDSSEIKTDFGKFKFSVQQKKEGEINVIEVKREYVLNEGTWAPETYADLRDFIKKINLYSNQKAVIIAAD